MLVRFSVLVSILGLLHNVQAQTSKIKLTVGTMAYCGDTVRFIRDQLVPTFNQYEEFLEVEFVPWGRTLIENEQKVCRRGSASNSWIDENWCWADRLQRCALNLLKGNQRKIVEYMACEFTPPLPGYSIGSYACAIAAGLSVVDVDYCVNNPQNDSLDEDASNASIEPMSVINFIPYILVNGEVDRNVSNEAERRLSSVICFLLAADPNSGISGCYF